MGLNVEALADLAKKHNLSGSDFFVQATLVDGELVDAVNTQYMSDEHYEHCPDNSWWCEYATEGPEDYPEIISFLIKHNSTPEEGTNV